MKFLFVIVCIVGYVHFIQATSNADPNLVFTCDATSSRWGCDPKFWSGGNRLRCMNASTQLMPWATQTTKSECYRITAGEESALVTTYTPGEFVKINIRVTCYKKMFRGILLYAVDSRENKVGEWDIPENEPALYSKPWVNQPNHECHRTIMHFSAEWKPYYSFLFFKAPAAGTGTIRFRVLFKYGNANTGDFYWPLNDLALTEGAPKQRSLTWITATDKSCTVACQQISKGCSETGLQALNGEQAVITQLGPFYDCQIALSGCGDDGALFDEENNYCYYIDSTCAAQGRTRSSVTCNTMNPGITRVCPCGTYIPPPTSAPLSSDTNVLLSSDSDSQAATTEGDVSSASKPLLSLFLAVPLLMNMNPRITLIAMIFAALPMSLAHNWISTFSRSPSASTYQPCKPPMTDLPHAQVGPGQFFQIEWATGHGDFTYFTIIHSRNSDKLKLVTTTLLDDYIAKAPNGSNTAMQRKFQKYHRKDYNSLDNRYEDYFVPNMFAEVVYSNSTDFINRTAVMGANVRRFQLRYNPEHLNQDVRVSYQSSLYPWIEAVYKFRIVSKVPSEVDTANFVIPGFGGPGRYVVHYYWRGYRDCTDVDYKTTQVRDIYGVPAVGGRWSKIDHCLFENVQRIFYSYQVFTNPEECLKSCAGGCGGVNVVPLMAPSDAYQGFKPLPNDETIYPNAYGSDFYVPWSDQRFNTTRGLYMANPSPNKYLCYSLLQAAFTDTTDEYTLATDPEDPIFYSTCYYKFEGNFFEDYADKVPKSNFVPWRFFDKCIDCNLQANNTDVRMVSKWKLADKCINCDLEPGTSEPLVTYPVESGVKCDGQNSNAWSRPAHTSCTNNTQCWKQMKLIGRSTMTVSAFECQQLVSQDAECSNYYIHRNATNLCYCYSKQTCCRTCSRVPDAAFNTYQVKSTPDPTCATGTLSTDRTTCCSKECGTGNCNTVVAAQDPVGFCSATAITRRCSQYGPPCKM